MHTVQVQVLQNLSEWSAAGVECWLCTIVGTIGSSPRPVGSLLACNAHGDQTGSLSGGCVEEDLLERIKAGILASSGPELIEYGVTAEENERLGLPCGGRLHVLVQRIGPGDKEWLHQVLEALAQRRCTRRRLDRLSGTTTVSNAPGFAPLALDPQALEQSFGPSMRMLLVGCGQLSQSLAELALSMDYEVMVTDPREHMLAQWAGPPVPLLSGMPDDVLLAQADDEHSVIITLTHDPRIDDMALMAALETDAWYVGALGSQRTTDKRLERLSVLGISAERVSRLHAPVGLPIGSKTPMEIAIAIMAELTQLRRAAERRG
jgi:xanthine dehydrogenase accessory factor